jgi:ATP-dependent DNA helicase RecG
MTQAAFRKKLEELIQLPAETEWVEFKAAKGSFDFDTLGRYFSALSNEANLFSQPFGWLVFGVENDRPRQIVGTRYKEGADALNKLKQEISQHTNYQLTCHVIQELSIDGKRVLLFQIPAAMAGVPTEWRGRVYGRHGESVSPLSLSEIDRIRAPLKEDWSAKVVDGAGMGDLDPKAIEFARTQFREKNPKLAGEIALLDDATFLNKAKVCVGGKVTRTGLLLLGKEESTHFLSPSQAWITWVVRDEKNQEKDYKHFGPPFIFSVDSTLRMIRNLTVRVLPSGTMFPLEIPQYDPWILRETLNNCIAHQDYTLCGRINVVETPDSLLFTNLGSFIPGTVEEMIRSDSPPAISRNPFLARAMANLGMIDTVGSGIKKMFTTQRSRFFPLPDFDLSEPGRVKVRHLGKILDENYTRMLIEKSDLDLETVMALDRVQKKRALSDETFKLLRAQKLIEGRRPNLFISAKVAAILGDKATYIKNRGLDKAHYQALVKSFLGKFGESKREDLDKFLREKISDALSEEQKTHRIRNLIQEMRRQGVLECAGHGRGALWKLAKRADVS